jgi:hypothetical protein
MSIIRLYVHEQGGVFWGDDVETINQAVSKGSIADDALFREAEKMGIDIRHDSSAATAAADESSFSFSFGFGGGDDSTQAAAGYSSAGAAAASAASSSAHPSSSVSGDKSYNAGSSAAGSEGLSISGIVGETETVLSKDGDDAQSITPPMSLIDIVSNAMLFSREK